MDKHIGSSFDDFLEDEGILAESEAVAVKRVIAYQVSQIMESNIYQKQLWHGK